MRFIAFLFAAIALSAPARAEMYIGSSVEQVVLHPNDVYSNVSVEGRIVSVAPDAITITDGEHELHVVTSSSIRLSKGDLVRVSGKIGRSGGGLPQLDATDTSIEVLDRAWTLSALLALLVELWRGRVGMVLVVLLVIAVPAMFFLPRLLSTKRTHGIFICYRRHFASANAGRLAEFLGARFGRRVFIDIAGIDAGDDFTAEIDAAIRSSSVVLVIIHEGWLDHRNAEGSRALDDPNDFVRLEIASALRSNVRVVPLLLNGAAMPGENQLPKDIAPLARRQALSLRDEDWQYYVGKLFKAVAPSLRRQRSKVPTAALIATAAAIALAATRLFVAQTPTEEPVRPNIKAAPKGAGAEVSPAVSNPVPLLEPTGKFDPRLYSGEGAYVITASQTDERSWDDNLRQHSYFTHFVIEALRRSEGLSTIKEVFGSVSSAVADAVKHDKQAPQHPQMISGDGVGDLRIGVFTRASALPARRSVTSLVHEKYALVIGINRFQDPSISYLEYAVADARAFAAVLTDSRFGRFREENVTLLLDQDATREAILNAMQELFLKAREDDLVVLYINTHGSRLEAVQGLGGLGHIITYDTRLRRLWVDAIEYQDFAEKAALIRAKRKVTFLDAAFAIPGKTR